MFIVTNAPRLPFVDAPDDADPWRALTFAADSTEDPYRALVRDLFYEILQRKPKLTPANAERLERVLTDRLTPLVEESMRSGIAAARTGRISARVEVPDVAIVALSHDEAARIAHSIMEQHLAAQDSLQKRGKGDGLNARQNAVLRQQTAGLTERMAHAVYSYRAGLAQTDMDPRRIGRLVVQRAAQAIESRANAIARTESMRAANLGQELYWHWADANGVIDGEKAYRVWIVTPDDRLCAACAALSGARTTLIAPFKTDFGPVDTPPLHPHCRCTVGLRNVRAQS